MILEFAQHDQTLNENENKELIIEALQYKPNSISIFSYYIKNLVQITDTPIICPIDFPVGISDGKTRLNMAEFALKNGAKGLDIVYPAQLIINRKYEKFREDIKNFKELTNNQNINIRYILEYRKYSYELLYKLSQVLLDGGVSTILLSTGYFLDDINDNIIAAGMIMKKTPDINVVLTANIWTKEHVNNIVKSGLYGFRANTINGLKLFYQNISSF
jgi:deoxyribose-phosphate aldolase